MKTKSLLFSAVLISLSFISLGQNNYSSGYVVTNSNDTIRGFIDLGKNDQNSKSCIFYSGLDNARHVYSPDEIKAYRIENSKYYVARDIMIENARQRAFLEYLVDGIVDLYYLKDALEEYYFIEKDTSLVALSNKEVKVFREGDGIRTNDKEFTKNSNQYKGMLLFLFQDSPGLKNKIEATSFEYKSLVRITREYHESVCKDYSCIDFTRTTKQKLYLEFSGGLINTWMGLKTSNDKAYDIRPYAGIQLRFIPFKDLTSWNVLTGLSYSTNILEGDFDNNLFYYSNTKTYHIYTRYAILRIPITFQYSLPAKRLQPYFSLSYVNVFLINEESTLLRTGDGIPQEDFLADQPGYEYGFSAGLGLKYNLKKGNYFFLKNEFEYRLSFSANSHDALDYLRYTSWLINVGYGIGI